MARKREMELRTDPQTGEHYWFKPGKPHPRPGPGRVALITGDHETLTISHMSVEDLAAVREHCGLFHETKNGPVCYHDADGVPVIENIGAIWAFPYKPVHPAVKTIIDRGIVPPDDPLTRRTQR
jgi:hypothetical protein